MARLSMDSLYRLEGMAAQSLDLEDCLILLGVPHADLEDMTADADVLAAFRAGLARGLRELTSVVRQQALGGHIGAAKSLLARNGDVADEIEAVEAKRRRGRVINIDVIASVSAALEKQRQLLDEGMGGDDE
jgi:hypothetical protein